MQEKLERAAEMIRGHEGEICIISHYDADGIASASIASLALTRLGKKHSIMIVKEIKPNIIDKIEARQEDFLLFLDIGSGSLNYINYIEKPKIIILDHHLPDCRPRENILHINSAEIGREALTGSALTWLLSHKIDAKNIDLVGLAVIGTVGDCHEVQPELLIDERFVKAEHGLNFFGRMSRPIHKVLELSYEPYIPNITGNESAAVQLLSELNIPLKENGRWRTLNDLNRGELGALVDRIIKYTGYADLFGYNYNIFTESGALDAKECATMINACSRLDDPDLAIEFCKSIVTGNLDELMPKIKEMNILYRRMLSNYLTWLQRAAGAIVDRQNAIYIDGKDVVNPNFIGTINSIFIRRNKIQKPVISFAYEEDGIKVSARSANGVNIGDVMARAARVVDGIGGGHKDAGGAVIPAERLQEFIDACEREISTQKIHVN